MTPQMNKLYQHQLSCGHIFHSRDVIPAGDEVTCRPCDYAAVYVEHCMKWRARCHHCFQVNDYTAEDRAIAKAQQHANRYPLHVVKIIGPMGNILFLVGADRILPVDLRVS